MLGEYIRQKKLPKPSVGSTDFLETTKKHWVRPARAVGVSLDKKENIWEEFWLQASSIHKACPRMCAQACAAGIRVEEDVKAETLWLFGQGNAYHNMIQQEVLPHFPENIFWGSWERFVPIKDTPDMFRREISGGDQESTDKIQIVKGWGPKPEDIEDAHGIQAWRYKESKIRLLDLRVVVKLDGVLMWSLLDPDKKDEVVEIKTEKIEAKDDLNPALGGQPRAAHVEQAHVGMLATGLDRARIIYVFKGARTLSEAIVEHIVERDGAVIDRLRRRAFACVDAVRMIERVRDEEVEKICAGSSFSVLTNENQKVVREVMAQKALEVDRLDGCIMKSKGVPKYCAGRDLCFPKKKAAKKKK